MASDATTNANSQAWDKLQPVPIAQLHPDLPDPSTRIVEGEVTVVWPYSLVTRSIAFKLVETDFRLRRDNGQVRIEFHGAAGKAVSDAAPEGGDGIRLSLSGATWEKASPETVARPGTLEWQLKFTSRLRLKLRRAESLEEILIDIETSEANEEPAIELPREITPVPNAPTTPGPASPTKDLQVPTYAIASLPAKRLASATFDADEYASPAFIKRARVSYGSLFEGGLDNLDREERSPSRRKRPRFSMNANWRYTSRTPSPEPELPLESSPQPSDAQQEIEPAQTQDSISATHTPRNEAVDEGSQPRHDVQGSPLSMHLHFGSRTTPPSMNRDKSPSPQASFIAQTTVTNHGDMESIEDTIGAGDEGAAKHHPFLYAGPASHTEDTHMEPAEDVITGMAQSQNTFTHPQLATATEHDNNVVMSDIPSTLATNIPLVTHQEDIFPFAESGYHSILPTVGQHMQGLGAEANALFPLIPNELPHDEQVSQPFTSQHLQSSPWQDDNEASLYPPPPTLHSTQVPVEIIGSSSPPRQPSEEGEELEEQQSDASGEKDLLNDPSMEGGEDSLFYTDERNYDDADNESQEESDVSGEDYGLENYDAAKADDIPEVERSPAPSSSGSEEQVADIGPESDRDEADELSEEQRASIDEDEAEAEADEYTSASEHENVDDHDPDQGIEGSDGYDDEDEYDENEYDEEGEEEEEEEPPSRPAFTPEPVFISLLSDSEDDNEEPAPARPVEESVRSAVQDTEHQSSHDDHRSSMDEDGGAESDAEDQLSQPSENEDEVMQDTHIQEVSLVDQLIMAAHEADEADEKEMDTTEDAMIDRQASHSEARDLSDSEQPEPVGEESRKALQSSDNDTAESSHLGVDAEDDEVEPASSGTRQQPAGAETQTGTANPLDTTMDSADEDVEETVPEVGEPTMESSDSPVTQQSSFQAVNAVTQDKRMADDDGTVSESLQPSSQLPVTANSPGHGSGESATQSLQTQPDPRKLSSQTTTQFTPEKLNDNSRSQLAEPSSPNPEAVTDSTAANDRVEGDRLEDSVLSRPGTPNLPASGSPKPKAKQAGVESFPRFEIPSSPVFIEPLRTPPPLPTPSLTHQTDTETGTEAHGATTSPPRTTIEPEVPSQVRSSPKVTPSDEVAAPSSKLGELSATHDKAQEVGEHEMASAGESLSEDEYSFAAEQQIMAESQEYQSTHGHDETEMPYSGDKEKGGASAGASQTEDTQGSKKAKMKPERDISITVQSLRSWDRRKSTSSDAASDLQDPSILLARAPAPTGTTAAASPSAAAGAAATAASSREDAKSRMTVHVTRSMVGHADPSLDLARAPRTPTETTHRHTTPDRSLETPALSQSLRSKTPESPADVMNTPSAVGSTVDDEHVSTLKRKLTQDLRNNLPDYLPLKSIRNHLNKTTDVIGVVTTTPPQPYRPKNGPRDYMMEVMLTDHAAAPNSVLVAQFFRPHQASLPTVEMGDVVILRRFQTLALRKRGVGVRTGDESSWAVFEKGDEEMLPQIKGPPVELSDVEVAHAEGLRRWWGLLDGKARDKLAKVTGNLVQAGKPEDS